MNLARHRTSANSAVNRQRSCAAEHECELCSDAIGYTCWGRDYECCFNRRRLEARLLVTLLLHAISVSIA